MTELSARRQRWEPTESSLGFWRETWQSNNINFFHQHHVSETIKSQLLSKLAFAKQQQCVLFPLCGKILDMVAVLETGHRVIGIDGCASPVEAFFKENDISYGVEKDESNQCQIFKGIGRPVTIYCADFFTFNKPVPVIDYIWDRRAIVAVNPSNREKYRDSLLRLMTPGHTKLILVAVDYDDSVFPGPPYALHDADVNHLFGADCSIQYLESHDKTEEFNAYHKTNPVRHLEDRLHLIERKQK